MGPPAASEPFRGIWLVIVALMVTSMAINLLMLAAPLYMLQVFDRVLTGRSLETLLLLSTIVVFALLVMGALDGCRSLVLARLGDWLERRLGPELFAASVELSVGPEPRGGRAALADLAAVRQFLSTPGVGALFDAPWMPFFIAMIWLVHPSLGLLALAAAVVLMTFAVAGEMATRHHNEQATRGQRQSDSLTETVLASAEVVRSMGLVDGLRQRWSKLRAQQSGHVAAMVSRLGLIGVASKSVRLIAQSAVLGLGAYLVLERAISPGEMVAASIILSRALAPVEVAIGSWRQFVAARSAWHRLRDLLHLRGRLPPGLDLPAPVERLDADHLLMRLAPGARPLVSNVSFSLMAGDCLGIAGSSGAGKSTLARMIVGAWQPSAGTVRLDGADLGQWDRTALGRHVGYLPQQIDLFGGTVAENIARFQAGAELDAIIAAAWLAGVHDMIQSLPAGYQTDVGLRGERLSGGQRQGVALARALFGDPFLLVLDEPDASLDQQGHDALLRCVDAVTARGAIVVIVAHRRSAFGRCNRLLLMQAGEMVDFGPAREVVARIDQRSVGPLRAVPAKAGGT